MSSKFPTKNISDRTGSIVPLVAVLLPVFFALIAFAIDYGVIIVSNHDLQNAADVAAIGTLQTLTSSHSDDADLAAFSILSANRLNGQPIEFDMQQDVHYGTWDADNRVFTQIDRTGTVSSTGDTSGNTIPPGASAVRIVLTRSVERKNAIRLFFGQILGKQFADVNIESIAASTSGCTGFVGLESVRLHNRLITDSYNSNDGDYGSGSVFHNGDVCSDGPVLLDYSAVEVRGDVQGSTITIAQGSNGLITGGQSTPSGTREAEPVDFSVVANGMDDNNTIPNRPPYDYRGTDYVDNNGDFILDGGQQLTLSSGVYHFRNMTVNGGARLTINGNVQIYIDRKMTYDNGTSANPGATPNTFQIFVGDGPVKIQGGHDLHAVIYAPAADVTIDNNAQLFGSLFAETLTAGGGARLHYDEALSVGAPSSSPPSLVN